MNFDEAKSRTRQTKDNKQAVSEVSPIIVEEVPVDEVRVLELVRAGAAWGMSGMFARALFGRKGCGRAHVLDRGVGELGHGMLILMMIVFLRPGLTYPSVRWHTQDTRPVQECSEALVIESRLWHTNPCML